MQFVALDFETANSERASACAVGIAKVHDGRVAERHVWLIRPKKLYVSPFNHAIHGISEADLRDQPEFNALWPTLLDHLKGSVLIAHNAGFDISVLRYSLDAYGIPYPELKYHCSRTIARQTWPWLGSYALNNVANHLGIHFKHHDASEDAMAAAEVVIHAGRHLTAESMEDICLHTKTRMGYLYPGGWQAAGSGGSSRKGISNLTPERDDFDPHHPLYRRTVVFTGTLQNIKRREAAQQVVNAGGACSETVDMDTAYVVIGQRELSRQTREKKNTKLVRAEALISEGRPLRILTEAEFLRLI